jgi:hypothetical protein
VRRPCRDQVLRGGVEVPARLGLAQHQRGHLTFPDPLGSGQHALGVDERLQRECRRLGDPHQVGPGEADLLVCRRGHATLRTSAAAEVAQQSGPRAKHVNDSGGGSAGFTERQCMRGHRPGVVLPVCGW